MSDREKQELRLAQLARVERIERTLATLIGWMAGSANSPIRMDEAKQLLRMLEADDE